MRICHFTVASYLDMTLRNAGMNTCCPNTASFLAARRENQFCSGGRERIIVSFWSEDGMFHALNLHRLEA